MYTAVGTLQDQLTQPTAESSRAATSGADAPAVALLETSAVPTAEERSNFASTKVASTVPDAPEGPPPPTAAAIAVGDKLKLSFFEPLTADKFSAGRNRQGPSFSLRAEFSGEYVVASDWSVTVPVIGRVIVAHRTAEVVANDLTETFDKLIGHAGFVTATITSRSPIYVIGPVKTPGAYPFSPGLTILHAIALAGGLDQGLSDMGGVAKDRSREGHPEAERGGRCHAEIAGTRGGADRRARRNGAQDPAPAAGIGRGDRGCQSHQRAE
ncbi:SLBB domain-containing protein [Bradyrhizobium sp. NAS80.1]|uniref:polysaccharide biosynthesis/export family protein n=1 Tax=Bradyrhizobium sp. NAS80.1 TaxID=1680159 RepID=UPI001AEF986A|nr:SLBB domain-containing protein [Bradyrhizobium sp. NAS80.1]